MLLTQLCNCFHSQRLKIRNFIFHSYKLLPILLSCKQTHRQTLRWQYSSLPRAKNQFLNNNLFWNIDFRSCTTFSFLNRSYMVIRKKSRNIRYVIVSLGSLFLKFLKYDKKCYFFAFFSNKFLSYKQNWKKKHLQKLLVSNNKQSSA